MLLSSDEPGDGGVTADVVGIAFGSRATAESLGIATSAATAFFVGKGMSAAAIFAVEGVVAFDCERLMFRGWLGVERMAGDS